MPTLRFDLGPNSYSKTISTGDTTRLEAAVKKNLGLAPDATSAQTASALAEWLWSHLKSLTKDCERNDAFDTAASSITEITLT